MGLVCTGSVEYFALDGKATNKGDEYERNDEGANETARINPR
jgi:hypothetical protein